MMKQCILALGATVALSGCGIIINAVETVSDTVQTFTDVTSSTTGALDGSDKDEAREFVNNNFDTISKESARGGGSSIVSLAQLMQVSDSNRFASWLQQNHNELFSGLDSSAQLVDRIVVAQAMQ